MGNTLTILFLIVSLIFNFYLLVLLFNERDMRMRFDSKAYNELFHSDDEKVVMKVVKKPPVVEEEDVMVSAPKKEIEEGVEDIEEVETDEVESEE